MYLKRIAFLFLAFFSFALQTNPAAAAFSIEYQAPADPATQGFSAYLHVAPTPQVIGPIANDLGYPAWSISGLGLSSQFVYLTGALTADQKAAISSQGFTLTLRGRALQGNAPAYDAGSNTIIGGAGLVIGSTHYTLELGINSSGNTVAVLATGLDAYGPGGSVRAFGTSYTYTLNDAGYHTYDLIFNPNTRSASLFIDGVERISGYAGYTDNLSTDWGLVFGALSGGAMNFNLVRLTSPAVVPVACNGLTGEALQTCSSYEFSLEQGTQKTDFIQLINPGTVSRTTTLEVLNPHSDLAVSLSQSTVSVGAGQTQTLPIVLNAGATPIGVYDDLLLKVTADDGSTLYASIKINVGSGPLPDLAITANDIRSTINPDGTVTLAADIRNQGLALAENVQVQFYEFGNALGSPVTVAQIAPNGIGTTSITVSALTAGDHLIRVAVDPAGAIAELDETNNEASRLITIGSSGPPTEGNILVTGSLPATVYTNSLFALNGRAVYDLYVNGVRYTDYVVKGGSVQITVKAGDGTEWVYGDVYTDVDGNFSKALQAPATPGTYRVTMTVTDKTFVGTRELVFIATEPPPAGALPPLQSPPAEWGAGHFEWDGATSQWVWTWTDLLLTGPVPQQDVFVYSKDIYFSKNNPAANEEITVFAAIRYWASSSALIAQNVPVNVYATYPGEPKVKIGQTLLKSLSVGSPDFGARYVYATWKNPGDGIYLIEFEIDPSYAEANKLNNAATRAIIAGQISGIPQGVIAGQVIAPLGGLGGVTIEILDAATGQPIGNAITDATGFYLVGNLPLGALQVRIDTPSGYVPDAETKTTTVTNQAVSTVDFRLTTQPEDTTPPVITPTVTGTLGNNGWYTSDVAVSWEVTDDESPITVTDGCQAANVTADTAGVTFTCSATSTGGTASESVTIKRDTTPPAVGVTGVVGGASYPFGSVPTAGCTTTDALSGVQAQATPSVTGGTNGIGNFTASCAGALDNAGNAGAASVTYQVYQTDTTPPVIAPIVDGTLGSNGWYTGNVSVGWTVTDGESAITAQNGCGTAAVTADTAGVTFTCSATSTGGTASESVTIKRDATPPAVGVTGVANGATYTLGSVPTAGCTTTDALSGVQTQAALSVTGGDANGLGTFTASCTGALDNAGNAGAAASATYAVTDTPPAASAFSAFSVNPLRINQRLKTFFLLSTFTLGANSNGINPAAETVTLRIAGFTTTIPAGAFYKGHTGVYAFAGKINNVALEVLIAPLGNNRFGFQAGAYGANFGVTENPVKVMLAIGNDSGEISVNASIIK